MPYNYSYNVCALVVLIISFWFLIFRKDMRRQNTKIFFYLLTTELLACVFNIWGAYLSNLPSTPNVHLQTFVDSVYLLAHCGTAPLCGWYFINFMGLRHKLKQSTITLYFMPTLIFLFIPILVPQLRHLVFYYNTEGQYVRGPLIFWTVYLAGYLYSALTILLIYIYRKRLSQEQVGAVVFLILMSVSAIFIQQVFLPRVLLNEFFLSIGTFMVLLSVDNQNWVYNFMTHTYNRLTFRRHLQADFENHTHFHVLAVSISRQDYLKALMLDPEIFQDLMLQVANYLKGLRYRLNIYYCETGTFTIPVYDDSHWNADSLAEMLAERFSKPWFSRDTSTIFPVRITKIAIPSEAETFNDLQQIIDLTFEGESEEPEIRTASQLLNMVHSKETEPGDPDLSTLPEDLGLLLNDFTHHIDDLTPAERAIVLYYLDGYEISEIPDLAGISINTVRKHNKNIYHKLQVASKEELMLYLDLLERCNMLEPIEKALRGSGELESA